MTPEQIRVVTVVYLSSLVPLVLGNREALVLTAIARDALQPGRPGREDDAIVVAPGAEGPLAVGDIFEDGDRRAPSERHLLELPRRCEEREPLAVG